MIEEKHEPSKESIFQETSVVHVIIYFFISFMVAAAIWQADLIGKQLFANNSIVRSAYTFVVDIIDYPRPTPKFEVNGESYKDLKFIKVIPLTKPQRIENERH